MYVQKVEHLELVESRVVKAKAKAEGKSEEVRITDRVGIQMALCRTEERANCSEVLVVVGTCIKCVQATYELTL